MPSTLQSRGFDVNVMPSVQLANPALFDPYGGISRGLQSGLSMGAQLQDIILRQDAAAAEAQIRPLRQQMMQAELSRSNQQRRLTDLEMPRREVTAKEPVKIQQSEFLDYDDQGNLAKFGSFKIVDPLTGEEGYQPRAYLGTVKTKAQLEQEKLNSEALRGYRANMGQAAATRAATAEQVAAFKQQNPTVRTKSFYDQDLNVFEQVINPDGSLGEAVQIMLPNGQPAKKPQTQMDGLAGALAAISGAGAAAPSSPAPTAPAAVATNLDALGALANQFSATATTPPPAAIQYLRENPQSAAAFDLKYGKGAAALYLKRG